MAKNNLGQPTISDVVTFFCDPCNAVLCAGCPVNDILQAEKAAQQSVQPTCSTCGANLLIGDVWWNECSKCHSKIASG